MVEIILDPVLNVWTPHVRESDINLLSIVRDLILQISDEKEQLSLPFLEMLFVPIKLGWFLEVGTFLAGDS